MAKVPASSGPRRWLWPWDGFLVVSIGIVVVLVARDANATQTGRGIAVACLVLAVVGWAAVGRRTVPDDADGRPDAPIAGWYVAFVAVLFAGAVAGAGISTFALFGLCPIAFLCLSVRPALVAVTVLNLTPIPVDLLRDADHANLRGTIGVALLGLAFAALIGTAIDRITKQSADRARLIAELSATRAEVAALSHEAGVAAERTRLAAEIHDTLAQGFASIVTLVQAAESEVDTDRATADRHLALAVRTARENLAEARAMVTVLAPADLLPGTLAQVVGRQVARLAEATGASTRCTVEGIPEDLPTTVEVVLVRALQESLTNIRKHAYAATVTVDLLGTGDSVTLTVTDDGSGFDPATEADGYGLRGMLARVEQVAGRLTVRSAPGLGTTLTLELPT